MSSSRFHTINTARVHTQSLIPSHTSEETTPTQQYSKDKIIVNSHATRYINKDYKHNKEKSTFLLPLQYCGTPYLPKMEKWAQCVAALCCWAGWYGPCVLDLVVWEESLFEM